jgi:hypothetical protein
MACQCGEVLDIGESADRAFAIFVGRVHKVERLEPWSRHARREFLNRWYRLMGTQPEWLQQENEEWGKGPQYGYRALFRVQTSWKGPVEDETAVYTGMWSGDCGFPFETGRRYLVYAVKDRHDRGLFTSTCTRTIELGVPGADNDMPVLHKWLWEQSQSSARQHEPE